MSIVDFKLESSLTQAAAPFSLGHTFKAGDVPAGSQVVADIADFQCTPRNVWPDGSLKFASLSGRAPITAGVAKAIALSIGTPTGGAALSLANLKATGVTAEITLTSAKDWTFDTAAQTVGARLTVSSMNDVLHGTTGMTVNNSASLSGYAIAQDSGVPVHVQTASVSGGTAGQLQTVTCTVKWQGRRVISNIVKGATTRIYATERWAFTHGATVGRGYDETGVDLMSVGNTVTFDGIAGMTELNGLTGTVTSVVYGASAADSWIEVNIDSTAFTTYVSGGTATKNQLNTSVSTIVAYVRTGGGLAWNGTATTYSGSNAIAQSGVSWAGTDWDAPLDIVTGVSHADAPAWESGPQMSSWIYRKPIGSDPHLVAWLRVRLWADGAVDVLPWMENGFLKVGMPTKKSATYAFSLGGTQRVSVALELMHHQRSPLINSAALSYWLGADPDVVAMPDPVYMQATEQVPSYRAQMAANHARIQAQAVTYAPLQAGNFDYGDDYMPGGGYQRPIGLLPEHDMLYLVADASDRAKVLRSVIRNGFSAGRWALYYRDELTNRPPRFSQHPHAAIRDSQGFRDNGGSLTNDLLPFATGGSPGSWDVAHCPSLGYMAYLVTGDFYHMETAQFATTGSFLGKGSAAVLRNGAQALVQPCLGAWASRATAWEWRTRTQALAATADTDTNLRTELIASVEANVDHFHGRYVAQANNPYGVIMSTGSYRGDSYWDAMWMQDFATAAFGYSLSMGLPMSGAHRTKLAAFFQWKAASVVGRLGASNADFWYVNPVPYETKLSSVPNPDFVGGTGPWLSNWAEVYDQTYAATPSWMSSTEGLYQAEIMPGANALVGNMCPAIAYAVRHEVPGAAEGYARITAASNWPALVTQFNSVPVWSVIPASISAPAESAPMGPTLNIDVVSRFPGKLVIGNTGLGALGKNVAGPVNGVPGYMYGVFDDVLHAEREVSAPILTRPSAGNFKAYEDGAYSFTDAPDGIYNFTFQPMVGAEPYGPVLTEELVVGGTQAVAGWTEGADIIAVAGTFTAGVAASIGWTEGADAIAASATYADGVAAVIGWTEGEDLIEAILEFVAATPVNASIGWTESADSIEASVNVAVPVSENGLAVSLAEARYCARVDGTEHDIGLLIAIATYAGEAEHITGRKIINTPYTLKFDTFPAAIQIPATPLDSIVSFKYVDVNGDEQDLPAEAYRVDEMDRITPAFGTTWPPTAAVADAVKVNLVCGYGANHTTTPNGIKSFIMARIAEQFNPPKSPHPDYAKGLLDPFKVYNR